MPLYMHTLFRRILPMVLAVILFSACAAAPAFPAYDPAAHSASPAYQNAAEELLDEYRTLLSADELDWNANADAYEKEYPRVNRTYVGFYHLGLVNTLYAAFFDIDKNGTEELFVGLGDKRDAMEAAVYAFTGETFVPLSLTDTPHGYQIMTDGTFLQSDRSGEVTAVKRIAADGCTLEDAESEVISVGDIPTEEDLAALGGNLYLTSWMTVTIGDAADPFT